MRQNAMPLSLEATSFISVEVGTSAQADETVEEGNVIHQVATHEADGTVEEGNVRHQVATHEVEAILPTTISKKAASNATDAQCIALETWKASAHVCFN